MGAVIGHLYKKHKIKKFLNQLKAPNYEIALKMKKGKFRDYETYKKAQEMNISSLEEYIFVIQLKSDLLTENE